MGYASRANQNSRDNRTYPQTPSDALEIASLSEIATLKPGEKFILYDKGEPREFVRGRDAD